MKGIIISILVLFTPSFVKNGLLFSIQVWGFFIPLVVLLITHPKMSFEKLGADDKSPEDGKSLLLINLGAYLIILPVYFLFVKSFKTSNIVPIHSYIAIACASIAVIFRWWSIRKLGKFFTAEVTIQSDHRIIKSGPYAYIRHPSYTGAFVFWLLTPIIFNKTFLFPTTCIILVIVYAYRIHVEEKALNRAFGDAYSQYSSHTKKLIPFIF